eukprot:scaffold7021_cov23-Tisochrysis_lutea.AAC.1
MANPEHVLCLLGPPGLSQTDGPRIPKSMLQHVLYLPGPRRPFAIDGPLIPKSMVQYVFCLPDPLAKKHTIHKRFNSLYI